MSVKVEMIEGNKAKLEFSIEKEKFVEAIDQVYKENAKYFQVPGFRKGKVPKEIVMRNYGESTFYNDAFEKVANEEYPKAIEENNLKVVSKPEIDVVTMSTKEDLVFTAIVDLEPKVELGDYRCIEIEKVEYNVSEDDIKARLDEMVNQNARIITNNDQQLEKGNIAIIDFEGFVEGVPFEGGKAEKHELEIGSGSFIPGFEDQLIGMKVEEEKDINVTFPEQYQVEELKGKPAVFKVKLHEIKIKELPKIDDDFAKDVSEFDTLEALKTDIKNKMQESNEERAKSEKESKAIEVIVNNSKMEIPHSMIDLEVEHKVKDIEQNMQYQGLTLQQYLQYSGLKMDDFKIQLEDQALKDIKSRLVLEAIIAKENIEVTDEDVENKIADMAKKYNKDLAEYKKGISDSYKQYFKDNIKYEKVLKLIIDNVKFKK
ncbi:MAG: trigger factor [Clostridia bacterium]|nr:trigger factor [Clostridia bacterium]